MLCRLKLVWLIVVRVKDDFFSFEILRGVIARLTTIVAINIGAQLVLSKSDAGAAKRTQIQNATVASLQGPIKAYKTAAQNRMVLTFMYYNFVESLSSNL